MEKLNHYENESLINQYVNSLFTTIETEIKNFCCEDDFSISFKRLKGNKLILNIIFKISSKLNSIAQNVYFRIEVNEKFPEEMPYVICLSNFIYPTIFDGRNLLQSVLDCKWMFNKNISEVINSLPSFINRVIFNQINKMNISYGDYCLSRIYDLNQIIQNNEVKLFRCYLKKTKIIYCIISESHLLLFEELENQTSYGKLILYTKITSVNVFKGKSLFEKMEAMIGIELPFGKFKYLEVNFQKQESVNNLIDLLSIRKERLSSTFTISHDDFLYKRISISVQEAYDQEFFRLHNFVKSSQSNLIDMSTSSVSINKLKIVKAQSDKNIKTSHLFINDNSNDSLSLNALNSRISDFDIKAKEKEKLNIVFNYQLDFVDNKISDSIEEIKQILKYKESILLNQDCNEDYNKYLVREIILLYQKVISLDSLNESENISKLKGFIDSQKVKESLDYRDKS